MNIVAITTDDRDRLKNLVTKLGLSGRFDYFDQALGDGDRDVLIAQENQQDVGLCVLNFAPLYPLFKRLGIPEIQDLNVMTGARRAGVGASIVTRCEQLAKDKNCDQIGLGVGLDASYGAAQRLYVRMGYMPDGAGVSYDCAPVRAGEMRPVDDLLCLFMVKDLI